MVPERKTMPVFGASSADWNRDTFWYEPWGRSGVHKGIDIFAAEGTELQATVDGIVLFNGELAQGGNVVVLLGPKWRLHYYAHLAQSDTRTLRFHRSRSRLGSVGDSGNAKGKSPHLHYSIVSLFPLPWLIDGSNQAIKKRSTSIQGTI